MRRLIPAAAVLAALAFAGPAAAHGRHHSTTFRAKLAPAAGATVRGQARLVDAKRDRVSLKLRGLDSTSQYTWEVRSAPAGQDACTGTAVDGFASRALRVRSHGKAAANGRSKGFSADPSAGYAIVILDADGNVVACAQLNAKHAKGGTQQQDGTQQQGGTHDDPAGSGDDQSSSQDDQGEDSNDQGDDASEPADDPSGDDSSDDPSDG
jgi:hypothetical protein